MHNISSVFKKFSKDKLYQTFLWKNIALMMVLFTFISLTSCDTRSRVFDADSVSDDYLTGFLDALSQNDLSKAESLFYEGAINKESFPESFKQYQLYWGNHPNYTYEKMKLSASMKSNNRIVEVVYLVTPSDDASPFYVKIIRHELSDGRAGLYDISFALVDEIKETNHPIGGLSTISSWDGVQVFLCILSILCVLFTIYTAFHCFRHAKRRKWLWFAIILLVHIGVSIESSNTTNSIRVFISILRLSRKLFYLNGTVLLAVVIPIGAILYWLFLNRICDLPKRIQNRSTRPTRK